MNEKLPLATESHFSPFIPSYIFKMKNLKGIAQPKIKVAKLILFKSLKKIWTKPLNSYRLVLQSLYELFLRVKVVVA